MDIKEIGWKVVDCIHVAQDKWQALVNMWCTFGFHERLGNSWLSECLL